MRPLIDGIRQSAILAYGLDMTDAILLRTIMDMAYTRIIPTKMFDGVEYFMPSYAALCAYLPSMKLTRAEAYKRFINMSESGIMKCKAEEDGGKKKLWFNLPGESTWPLLNSEETFVVQKVKTSDPLKPDRDEIKKRFFELYRLKALEIRGTDKLESGSIVSPPWGVKQAATLKGHQAAYKKTDLLWLYATFFSDVVKEVADFTRYKAKAGYGYFVFHSQIGKLQMSERPSRMMPCESCGYWKGHRGSCPAAVEQRAELSHNIENAAAVKEELLSSLGGKSITQIFHERIGRTQDGNGDDHSAGKLDQGHDD